MLRWLFSIVTGFGRDFGTVGLFRGLTGEAREEWCWLHRRMNIRTASGVLDGLQAVVVHEGMFMDATVAGVPAIGYTGSSES
jgi:hypothetical protein